MKDKEKQDKEKEKDKDKEKNASEIQQLDPYIQQMEMKYKKQLELVKSMNGITEKNMRNIDKITKIELVLEQFPNMDILQIFTNLQELTLINVEIEQITGLTDLYNLRDLWLSENQIRKIENLSNCQQLRKLYLCCNKIEIIENLESLYNLEILWINNNRIKELKNLDNLINLQQFWICSNQIETIKTSLDNLKQLNTLNISGNKICSFKEVLNLNRLANLRIVAFQDPNYGDNPICNLCNYQTYILLDTLFISEEAKSFADATFMKKKMYYNMRIKTLQRTFSTIRKIMQKAFDRKLSFLDQDITYLHMIDFELKKNIDTQSEKQMSLVEEIQVKIQESHEQVNHLEQIYQNYLHQMQVFSKQCTNKLITELETGGNIRLEEGRGTEKWYQSCIDLIKSRFYNDQMEYKYNINDILVKRVIRIHNRFLKNKFEEKSEILQDQMKTNYKKSLEFLFYGIDPSKTQNELVQIIEEGFQQDDKAKQGVCPYPALTNSILGCDAYRIRQNLDSNNEIVEGLPQYLKNKLYHEKIQFIGPGIILICKVLIFKSVEDNECKEFDPEKSINKNYNQHPINKKDYSQETSIFRMFNNDQKHKLWFILDNNLVLPEYMVEFEYQQNKNTNNNLIKVGDTLSLLDNQETSKCFITPNNFETMKEFLDENFNQSVQQIIDPENELNKYDQIFNVNLELNSKDLDRSELFMIKPQISNFFRMCLNHTPPQISNSMDLQQYDFDALSSKSINLENLIQINMSNQNISDLKEQLFAKCLNLESLNLSFNFICELQSISVLTKLQFLDVSYNQISVLDYINQSKSLIFLNLNCNQISDLNEFIKLKEMSLLFLNVRCNQFKDNSQVFKFVIQQLQNITYLNNLKIGTQEYKRIEEHNFIEIDDEIIFQNAKFFNGYDTSIEDIYDKNNQLKFNVEILVLSHYKIQQINNLQDLTKIRQLYLDSNCIQEIKGLENLTLLEELILTNNLIQKIENLEYNIYLKKLELGNNNIQIIENLDNLKNLMQISLEDNQITNLNKFPDLANLMEMYLANNRIPTSREVLNIKHLNKLIILDMCGNPLTKDPNYRIYSLYHLKKLKVLDGIAVELNEQQMAKDLFTGRLTEELLLQRLNGVSPQKIAELDLSDCQLRDFEDVFNSSYFPQLQELNLSQNLFISTGMIGELDSLKILILNSNKIETLAYNMDISLKKGLNGVQNLEILDISFNNIRDFNGLQFCYLKELKILKADNNEIFRIDCLENLKTLKELDVCRNRIRQFDGTSFINCNPIKCLKIEDNSLKNFHHIQKLYKLQHLFAVNNKINDIPDVERLCELPYLKELELAGNPISRRNGYKIAIIKKLPQLIYLDGKEITIDEKEKYEVMTPQIQNNEKIQYPQYLMNQNNIHNNNNSNNNNNNKHYKINPVNFDGVFGNVRLPQDNFTHTNYINYSKNNYK